jgi:ribosomal protein S18 acetylase RimI-like enzyme
MRVSEAFPAFPQHTRPAAVEAAAEPAVPANALTIWRAHAQVQAAQAAVLNVLDVRVEVPGDDAGRARLANLRIRPIDLDRYEDDLRALHQLCLVSFADNAWYTPISENDFCALYQPFRDRIDPGYVLLAEDAGVCCGFIFSAVDPTRRELVIKTLAILPARRYAGLGALLVDAVQARAREQGLTHAIHALMHENNPSRNTARHAEVIRRYHLFEFTGSACTRSV